ncbi:MAG: A/G-specific adenine glycosylase [Clostridia bacterium]|nr:A/G-specific adenine glycosylase [Clostridia bacterium]
MGEQPARKKQSRKGALKTPVSSAATDFIAQIPGGEIARSLLEWFKPEARPMPWRNPRPEGTPLSDYAYGIWISESMLQQTQVSTVIPYWTRWMEKWPRVASLAAASEEEVLLMWEGLGYYNRARNLLKAARKVMELHGGVFPTRHEELLELPGIGLYTAGAICSIAYNHPRAIVDGNVIRLLCRLFTLSFTQRPSELKPQELLWQISERLVRAAAQIEHPQSCSAFNQAMMDMGATICTPTNPLCLTCPLSPHCKAYKEQSQSQYPQPLARPALILREDTALLVRDAENHILLQKRTAAGRNHGFWQLPLMENKPLPEAQEAFHPPGLSFISREPLAQLQHHITCYRITLKVYPGKTDDGFSPDENLRFFSEKELGAIPVTSSHRKLLRKIL